MSAQRQNELLLHVEKFWPDNKVDIFYWTNGPVLEMVDTFSVCRVKPASGNEAWIYLTLNAAEVYGVLQNTEFFIMSPREDMIHIEMLSIVAFYNSSYPLSLGKVVDIGSEWMKGSKMHHFLISLPYPYGPALEWANLSNGDAVRFLWLLPITEDEAEFAKKYGVEELERIFDEKAINPVDSKRKSVIK